MRSAIASAVLVALAALAGACDQPQASLRITTDVTLDGGVSSCEEVSDLDCVNFLLFELQVGDDYLAHCVPVTEKLGTLCDLQEVATGAELFRVDPGETVRLTLQGLRVYPVTGCQSSECPERVLFSGSTGEVQVTAGGTIELHISEAAACGLAEQFFPRAPGVPCEQVCGQGNVVCDALPDGCLCTVLD